MQKLRLFGMNGFFTLMLACTVVIGRGQQAGYLILIDADNNQPFIARIGDNQMVSSSLGHLIIPQLQDSSYKVCIRFPREAVPEQIFPVRVNKKDHGYQLRGADSSWVLYNWQSRETIKPLKELDSSRLLDQGVKREDGFSRLMAAVVNDTSVMYNSFAKSGAIKDSATYRPAGHDSAAVLVSLKKKPQSDSSLVHSGVRNKPPKDSTAVKNALVKAPTFKPEIKKLREVSLKVSRKLVYLDSSPEGGKDTITLFVYFETSDIATKKPIKDSLTTARQVSADSALNKTATKGREKESSAGKEIVKATPKDSVSGTCQQLASDPDLEALRSAILSANSLQDKISVASGAFIMKCFTVSQVKVLVELFVSDKAKYKLLDAARGHVSDADHFRELADTMTDKVLVKKFRLLAQRRG